MVKLRSDLDSLFINRFRIKRGRGSTGLDIHLIHVKSLHESALPLIITHGWPGSVIEMLNVVGPLTDPPAHGGDAVDAFGVVVPSMPGHGFSAKPAAAGWTRFASRMRGSL